MEENNCNQPRENGDGNCDPKTQKSTEEASHSGGEKKSASKFFRNFLAFQQKETDEKSCHHPIGEKLLPNDILKAQKTQVFHHGAPAKGQQEEHLDVSLSLANVPELMEKQEHCSTEMENQNVGINLRLSVSSEEEDSSLIRNYEFKTQQKDLHCGLNILKPSAIYDEGFEESAFRCDLKFATTLSMGDNIIPSFAHGNQESVKFLATQRPYLSNIVNSMISVVHLNQPFKSDDIRSQHKSLSGTINALIIDSVRGDIELSAANTDERKQSLVNTRHETGSALPAPDLKSETEIQFPEIVYLDNTQCQTKTCKNVPTADLNGTPMNDDNGMQELRLNLSVVGTKAADDMNRNFCVTEDNVRNGSIYSSEIKTEFRTEGGQNNLLPNTEFQTDVVYPLSFVSLQEMGDRRLSDEKTEDEVVEPSDVFDELFQDYVTKFNVTAKANGPEVASSDDECSENHQDRNQEIIMRTDVSDITPPTDFRFKCPSEAKLNKGRVNGDVFSFNNCSLLIDRLLENSHYMRNKNLRILLEDCPVQKILSLPTATAGRSTTNPTTSSVYHKNCSMSELQKGTCDNSLNKRLALDEVANVGGSRISSTAKAKSNQKESKESSSFLGRTQCSTPTKTLLSSSHSARTTEVLPLASCRGIGCLGSLSSFGRHSVPFANAKLHRDSTLVSERGIFATKYKGRPFACGHCGKCYPKMWIVDAHITHQHEERKCFSCKFCKQRFGSQKHLSLHLESHTMEERVSRDQSRIGATPASNLDECMFNPTEMLSYPGDMYNKSVTIRDNVSDHTKASKDADSYLRETVEMAEEALAHQRFTTAPPQPDCAVSVASIVDYACAPHHDTRGSCGCYSDATCRQHKKTFENINASTINFDQTNVGDVKLTAGSPEDTAYLSDKTRYDEEQSQKNACREQRSEHLFPLKDSCFQLKSSLLASQVGFAATLPFYALGPVMSGSNQNQAQSVSLKVVSEKRNLLATGFVYEVENSYPDSSQFSATTRTDDADIAEEFPSSSSQHSVNEIHRKDHERKGIICKICQRVCRHLHDLKEHMMIHTGEKPFKCSLCDKQFRIKLILRKHMNSHNGVKRLSKLCPVCGKTVYLSYMSTHMRMHSGEKPFECNVCGKTFPKKQNLEGHMRSHTGEKPFACGGCDKRFALYSNMVTHKTKCTKEVSDSVTEIHC